MEFSVIVVSVLAQAHKIVASLRNLITVKFQIQRPKISYQPNIAYKSE